MCDKRSLETLTHPTGNLEYSYSLTIHVAGQAAMRAAGINPTNSACKLTHGFRKFENFSGAFPIDAPVYITCRSAVQSNIVQHCLDTYPSVKWLCEHKFQALVPA